MTTPINQTSTQTQTATREKSKSEFEMLLEKDVKTQVWFEPYGSNDEIKLSVPLIRRYIATPARDKDSGQEIQPSDEECVKFLMLCKARRLNPFEGDAFMVPFWDGRLRRHAWSLITAHSAFLKRAELHPKYDGMESGVIVQDKDGNIIERKGDFRLNTDTLLGGWAIVYHKDKSHPKVSRVRLATYKKEFGVWMGDPEGMICKVAEAQGLRDSFPTMIGGMFLRDEMDGDTTAQTPPTEVKRPTFDGPAPPGLPEPDRTTQPVNAVAEPEKPKRRSKATLVEEPIDPKPAEQTPPTQPAQPASTPQPEPVPPSNETAGEKELRELNEALTKLCADNGISQDQLILYMRNEKWMKAHHKKPSDLSSTMLKAFVKGWQGSPDEMVKRIKGAK